MKTQETAKAGIAKNTLYSIGGALVLNGVLQLFIYPSLTAHLGSETIGNIIYIMGLINILGPSVGQALNTSRLVVRRDHEVSNGDYDIMLLLFSAAGSAVIIFMSTSVAGGTSGAFLMTFLGFLTVFRFYGDVEYRLSLRYREYFIYYLLASLGYVAGYFLYRITGNWYLVFITGEVLAIVYTVVNGSIYRNFLKKSINFKIALSGGITLVLSYLLTNLTLNIDKIILKFLLGSVAVTQYYVTSMIGKTLVLLVAPINTIIISYLTKEGIKPGRKSFWKFAGAGLIISVIFFVLCQIGTPLYVRLFYPDLLNDVRDLVTVVNISQILGVLSAYLFIVVLTFTEAKWQLILQGIHIGVLFLLVFIMTPEGGLIGFSYAVLIANVIRVGAVIMLGAIKSSMSLEKVS